MDTPNRKDFRANRWRKQGTETLMLQNISPLRCRAMIDGREFVFAGGELLCLRRQRGAWAIKHNFKPTETPVRPASPSAVTFGKWEMRLPSRPPIRSPRPMAVWQVQPFAAGMEWVKMVLTPPASTSDTPVATRMDYVVSAVLDQQPSGATLLVEPSLMRGRFTLSIAGHTWDFTVSDTGTKAQRIDLGTVLQKGKNTLRFRLHSPRHLDGIKWTPLLEMR
jgi:hypothetical protein